MAQPTVTIITPIYNTGFFVIKALECIKAQTFRDFEHIIIDDYSKDNSVEMVEKWIKENNHQCTFLKNEKNLGLCGTLNKGIKLAKGKYIKGLGDDEWAPDFLEKRVAFFEQQDESVGVVFSDMVYIDEESKVIAKSYYDKRGVVIEDEIKTLTYPQILNNTMGVIGPSAMTRKAVFDNIGLYDESLKHEGYDMWFRVAQKYKFAYHPEALIYYRHREKSMSNSTKYRDRFLLDWLIVYEKHLAAAPYFSPRLKSRFQLFAINNYYNGDMRSKWLKISYDLNKDLKSLFYLFLCRMKVKPEMAMKMKKRFKFM